jgi:hypothetical protein
MKIQKSIEIGTAAENIWPFLVNPAHITKWCSDVETIKNTCGKDSGVGGTFYFEEKAAGRLLKLHFVVTEWELNRCFSFKMTSGNFVKEYEQRYTLEPREYTTKVTCFEHVRLPLGIMGRAVGVFRKPISEARVQRMLIKLKRLGEA